MITPPNPEVPYVPTFPTLGIDVPRPLIASNQLDPNSPIGCMIRWLGLGSEVVMPDPMYKLIADDLRRQVESSDLQTGDKLKTELQLQEDYARRPEFSDKVPRNTIRDAISILVAEGLIEKRPGQGTFVVKVEPFVVTLSGDPACGDTASFVDEVARVGRNANLTVPKIEVHGASEAPELMLEEDKQA